MQIASDVDLQYFLYKYLMRSLMAIACKIGKKNKKVEIHKW